MKFALDLVGRPVIADPGDRIVAIERDYVIGEVDCKTLTARWVAHIVDAQSLRRAEQFPPRDGDEEFLPDPLLPEDCRVQPDAYLRSGYDRGHLAPDKDMRGDGEQAVAETYFMSNVVPQVGEGFNRGLWLNLERATRDWALKFGRMLVITGIGFEGEQPRNSLTHESKVIGVPDFFYKVIIDMSPDRGGAQPLAFMMRNTDHSEIQYAGIEEAVDQCLASEADPSLCIPDSLTNIHRHQVTIDQIERATGIDFLARLEGINADTESTLPPIWAGAEGFGPLPLRARS